MGQPFQWRGLSSDQWASVMAQNRQYVAGMCRKHGEIGRPLALDYVRQARAAGAVEANKRLRVLSESLELGDTGLTATVHDGELKRWCERHAKEIEQSCEQFTIRGSVENAIEYARKRVKECGLTFPIDDPENASKADWGRAMARVFCPLWWRRKVRKIQARKIETVARDIRLVSASAGIYASDINVTRRKAQRQRNRETLSRLEATSEAGDTVPMMDVVGASTANPEKRRHELMTRMRGFEECATAAGDHGLFVTLTTPSRFHAMSLNRRTGKAYGNAKFTGATPREAQAYFCRLWARMRAQCWREGIRPYGFRIAEPHHDGTPHWHMMLFCDPSKAGRLKTILRDYALEDSPGEPGAESQRLKIIDMDPNKGSAAGYIAKYVSKNIDGNGIEADLYGRDANDSAKRIDAWASTWGIRQFQQIGGASVTVWRELRRLQAEQIIADEPDSDRAAEVLRVWAAADSSDWAAYTMTQGGVTVKRDEQVIRAQYEEKELGRYYEPVKRLAGVVSDGFGFLCTRLLSWTIQAAGTAEKMAAAVTQATEKTRLGSSLAELEALTRGSSIEELEAMAVSGPGTGPPWTCVINCTDPGIPPGTDQNIGDFYGEFEQTSSRDHGSGQRIPPPSDPGGRFDGYPGIGGSGFRSVPAY